MLSRGEDIFLLEEDLNACILELSHRGQRVHRVSCETADRLSDDQVDSPLEGIGNHTVEAFSVFRGKTRNALIGVDLHKLPFGIALYELGVVVHLHLIGGKLLIAVGGYTGVACYFSSFLYIHRCTRV